MRHQGRWLSAIRIREKAAELHNPQGVIQELAGRAPHCHIVVMAMRRAERFAVGIAAGAAAIQFVVARYLPEYQGELDRDFPRMSPAQGVWLLGVPFAIISALVLTRRWAPSERIRFRLTALVAIAAVALVGAYLWMSSRRP